MALGEFFFSSARTYVRTRINTHTYGFVKMATKFFSKTVSSNTDNVIAHFQISMLDPDDLRMKDQSDIKSALKDTVSLSAVGK